MEDSASFRKTLRSIVIDNALVIGKINRQTTDLKAALSQHQKGLTIMPHTTEFTEMALSGHCQALDLHMEPVLSNIDHLQKTLHTNNIRLILAAAKLKDESSNA